jgi:hypothetical protein
MTRAEAIAIIHRRLAEADDATVRSVAEQLTVAAENRSLDSDLPRPLTEKELALIEQSKEDFRQGRTYTLEEAETYLDEAMDRRRAVRAKR